MRAKNLVGTLVLVLGGGLVGLAIAEVSLRIVPNRYAVKLDYFRKDESTVRYVPDNELGRRLAPDQSARVEQACYAVHPFSTNSLGFRDDEPGESVRVAVLGDSFVEGKQVSDHDHVVAVMESLLGEDVLAAATAGDQTFMEQRVYEVVARPYRPEVVVAFLYLGNDITKNSCRISRGEKPYCGAIENGTVVARRSERYWQRYPEQPSAPRARPIRRFKEFIRGRLVIYWPLAELKAISVGFLSGADDINEQNPLYNPTPPPEWQEAWQVTEEALLSLKNTVEEDNATLVVAIISEHMALFRDWRKDIFRQSGQRFTGDLDQEYPGRRIEELLLANGVHVVNLIRPLTAYVNHFDLGLPYVSFGCDGHWSPLGHFLAAVAVSQYLLQAGLLEVEDAGLGDRIADLATRPPQEILGREAFDQIYGGRVRFDGSTEVRSILGTVTQERESGGSGAIER